MSLETTLQMLLAPLAAGGAHQDVAPQGVAVPYLVWQLVVTPFNNSTAGASDVQNTRLQVDAYAATPAARKTLADAVLFAMASASDSAAPRSVAITRQNLYEQDTKLFRTLLEFSVWSAG